MKADIRSKLSVLIRCFACYSMALRQLNKIGGGDEGWYSRDEITLVKCFLKCLGYFEYSGSMFLSTISNFA